MLEIHELTRSFGDRLAVDHVSFQVPPGQLTGFVGANGAGKTTTMRMVMGLLAPTSGSVTWQGAPIVDEVRRGIGYMPEERGLYPKQQVLDQLVHMARLRGMPAGAARAEATELLGAFGLGERTKDKLEKLSLGNQQRVQVTAALMASPMALILDEPFSGLDPMAVDEMADQLRARAASGVPVLFSSHQLDLVDRLCDGLVILAGGRVVAQGTRTELESRGRLLHRLVTDSDAGWVRDLAGVTVVDVDGNRALLELAKPGLVDRVLAEAMARGSVRELAEVRPTLSEIYREVAA
ncbi:ABC transporter ATP-binding protein [Aestuariimicrobium ganziense]|uniref:ABC transporter ATP-binding protein n=1 Tax=Aestuariimicrobium ganziense TaxID=2773677 RepID=UPI0019437ED0|nr:ATP-binding cassette domain-containing protein [Aestuariimicrobium ganziense]